MTARRGCECSSSRNWTQVCVAARSSGAAVREVETLERSGRSSCGADGDGVGPEVEALEEPTGLLAVVDDGDEAQACLAAGASKNQVLPVLGSLRSLCAVSGLEADGAEHEATQEAS